MKPETSPQRLRLDGLKGLLIALICFGHIRYIHDAWFGIYNFLYYFHVAAFLALPFLRRHTVPLPNNLKYSFTHYVVPLGFFYVLAVVLFQVAVAEPPATLAGVALQGASAFACGTARCFDEVSGLKMFWFIPVLVTLLAVLTLWDRGGVKSKVALFALGVAGNLLAGYDAAVSQALPWGFAIVLFILIPGLAVRYFMTDREAVPVWFWALIAAFALGTTWYSGLIVNIGDTVLPDLTNPVALLMYDVLLVSTFMLLLRLAPLFERAALLVWLGRHSMHIYLMHPFILYAFRLSLDRVLPPSLVGALLVVLPLTLLFAVVAVRLMPEWLHKMIFQRAKPVLF